MLRLAVFFSTCAGGCDVRAGWQDAERWLPAGGCQRAALRAVALQGAEGLCGAELG